MAEGLNPFIDNIFKTQQGQLEARKIKQAEDQQKQQNDLENARLKEVTRQHDNEVSLRKAEQAANKAHQDAQAKQADFEGLIHLIQGGATPQSTPMSNTTGNPTKGVPAYTGPISGTQFAASLFATPDQSINVDAKKAGAVETAKGTAQEPFKAADDARTESTRLKVAAEQASAHHDDVIAQLTQRGIDNERDNATRLATMQSNNETRQLIAQGAAQTRLLLAHAGIQADDRVAQSYINDAYITGNQTQIPVKAQAAVRQSLPPDWTPISKTDQTQIEGIPLVEDLIGKVKQLADAGSGISGRLSEGTGIGAAGEAARTVQGLAGNLSRIFGGEKGVLTQTDINRMNSLVYSKLNTDKKNQQNALDLEQFLHDKIAPVLSKYAPAQAEQILLKRGISPSSYLRGGKAIRNPTAIDPMVQNYANDHFGGDVAAAQAAIAAQQGGR